jgi:glycosyltransferase involved in cell wall biosynthesis
VIALNEFARQRLVATGFARDQVVVIPNMVELGGGPRESCRGEYAMFAGRMCREKGVSTLLAAARMTPEIPVHLFGDGPTLGVHRDEAPPNAVFHGQTDPERMASAYRKASFVVVPSRWFEGCPLVISEAMSHGLPVVASRLGGLPELVDHDATGVLFEPGDAEGLAVVMRELWSDPRRCQELGRAGRSKAEREYSEAVFWSRTVNAYELACKA